MKYQNYVNIYGDYDFRELRKNLNVNIKKDYIFADLVGIETNYKNNFKIKSHEFEGDIYGGSDIDKISVKSDYYYGIISTLEGNDQIKLNLGAYSQAAYAPGAGSNQINIKSYGAITSGWFDSSSQNSIKASTKFSDLNFTLGDSNNTYHLNMKGSYLATVMEGNGNNAFNIKMDKAHYEDEIYYSGADIETGSGHQLIQAKLNEAFLNFNTVIPSGEYIDSSYNFDINAKNFSEIYISDLHHGDINSSFKLNSSFTSLEANSGNHHINAKLINSSTFLYAQTAGNTDETSHLSVDLKQESLVEYFNDTDSQTIANINGKSSAAILVTGSANDEIYTKSANSVIGALLNGGDDSLYLSGSVALAADGGEGNDTLFINKGTSIFEESFINNFEIIELSRANIKITENLFFTEEGYQEALVQGNGKITLEDGENWSNEGYNHLGYLVYENSNGFSLRINDAKISVKEIEPFISPDHIGDTVTINGSAFKGIIHSSPEDDSIVIQGNIDIFPEDDSIVIHGTTKIEIPTPDLNLGGGDQTIHIDIQNFINLNGTHILGDSNDTVYLNDGDTPGDFIEGASFHEDDITYSAYSHSKIIYPVLYIQNDIEVILQ